MDENDCESLCVERVGGEGREMGGEKMGGIIREDENEGR